MRSSTTSEPCALFTVTLPSCEWHQCERDFAKMGMKTVPGCQSRLRARYYRIDQPPRRLLASLFVSSAVPGTGDQHVLYETKPERRMEETDRVGILYQVPRKWGVDDEVTVVGDDRSRLCFCHAE